MSKSMVAEPLVAIGFRQDAGGLLAARVLELKAVLHFPLNARNGDRR